MASGQGNGDVAFAIIGDIDRLITTAQKIRKDSPRSASVFNSIMAKIKGFTNSFDFYTLKQHPSSSTVFMKGKASQTSLAVYCPIEDEELFLDALSKTTLIDWSQKICFQYVPESLGPKMQQTMEKKSGKIVQKSSGELFTYDPSVETDRLVIPAGFTLKRMGDAAVEQMFAVWRYRKCSLLETFLALCKRAPNAAVFKSCSAQEEVDAVTCLSTRAADDEKAVAWACSTEYGPLGLQGVDSAIEEAGLRTTLERVVVRACAELMFKEGYLVHCYLEGDDPIRSTKGWSKHGSASWMWCCD